MDADGGEQGGGVFGGFGEDGLGGGGFGWFFKDVFGFLAGVAREARVEGFSLEGEECDVGAGVAGLGAVAFLAGAVDGEDLRAAAGLETERPVAGVGFELKVP